MRKFYTAEAVTEGHPDKLCDQIADAILDRHIEIIKNDHNGYHWSQQARSLSP